MVAKAASSSARAVFSAMLLAGALVMTAAADEAWPATVAGYVDVKPEEHPRLFFRKAQVASLRQRAATPEGKAIVARCKELLGGGGSARLGKDYTLWDGAAFGFLYQVTGDRTYADLARASVEHAWEAGVTDKDDRYSLNPPNEPMRYGPSLSAIAMAYDLCYDAWDPQFRQEQAVKMTTHSATCKKRGGKISLERMALNADSPNPVSNHFGLQVGGAGLVLLAVRGDPGVDDAKIRLWLDGVDKQFRKMCAVDYGETGYFAEHAGPGVISMTWTITPWLLAQRVCAGRDWLTARPQALAAEWISLRFVFQTMLTADKPMYPNPHPQEGYGTDVLIQNGGHHATYFCQGFGAIQPQHRAAMLWVYDHFVEPLEARQYGVQGPTFDVFSYPHRAMFALVNWPFDLQPQNPEKTMPKAIVDRKLGHCLFRNRWRDADDILVGVLFGARLADKPKRLMVWGLQRQLTFCNLPSASMGDPKVGQVELTEWKPAADGSGIVAAGGSCVAVDYSRTSGADALVIVAGAGADGALGGDGGDRAKVSKLTVGGVEVAILSLGTGAHPEPKVDGGTIAVGGQTITIADGKIALAEIAGPPTIAQ